MSPRHLTYKIFLVWNDSDADPESHYWDQYMSIEDAVSSHGDGVMVYTAEPKLMGKFKRKVEMVKIKRRKARKKK